MTAPTPEPQVTVLDTGGQYTHLITRKVRELGVYAEIRPSETPASALRRRKALIISGGPASVYEPGSPTVDPAVFEAGAAVLGICYGQQVMAQVLGGVVDKGVKGEYGLAHLDVTRPSPLFTGSAARQRIWMNHRDSVGQLPEGFELLASTDSCAVAAIQDARRRLYGVQFHPEVVQTEYGKELLSNFLFAIAGCTKDWNPKHRVPLIEERIREVAAERNVFFFVSGGVDSTVAYTLCLRALGPERVRGLYVDTGLMRAEETPYVRRLFASLGATGFSVADAKERFLGALEGVTDPERKRKIIGQQFVEVQERILASEHFLDGHWILGQGTIYPDTIESGGTAKADVIKTHHNRVAGIQELIDSNRIVEPLSLFYKDEVREIGAELGVPREFLDRHPFPGPGLAIRCLCSETEGPAEPGVFGAVLPLRSVGVQGDSRSYRKVLVMSGTRDVARATALVNAVGEINRVVSLCAGELGAVRKAAMCATRLERLRCVDAIVRRIAQESGFDARVWQFPVVLIPVGSEERPDSVVLRPIQSTDGMTAEVVLMPDGLLAQVCHELLAVEGIAAVFYDLTHKPPGTIEWE
ncbi:MAG TPA: glutamine-hydrolyzing GMP synthase [Solibacterales bacterium]|nr:glutamine-hydrolyzing GMP synthase [Bryobacterales bacterium]